jgi:putative acetyltransferase
VLEDGYGEVKRMFVDGSMRGKGLGHLLLEALEDCARSERVEGLRLETGVHNHEAVALYLHHGYEPRGPFGPYQPDPLSIFMEKPLKAPALRQG